MSPTLQTVMVIVAVLGSHLLLRQEISGLHRDMAGLRERMARLEGMMEGHFSRPANPADG